MKHTLDQAEKKMYYCYYGQATELLKEALAQARLLGNRELHDLISEALNESRRRHILGVLRCIKKIRIVALGKEQKL